MCFFSFQNDCYRLEGLDSDCEAQEFLRLRHAMDIVGFSHDNQQRFLVLAEIECFSLEFKVYVIFNVNSNDATMQDHCYLVLLLSHDNHSAKPFHLLDLHE